MSRIMLVVSALCISFLASTAAAESKTAQLSAAEIIDRNVAARGGLQGWRNVNSISMTGKMDAGGNQRPTLALSGIRKGASMPRPRPTEQVQLPFTLELKRPRKQRLELQFNGQTAVQVYDGNNGWKIRPFLNRNELEPFTAEELKLAAFQSELDGPLVDYAAKGTKIELLGTEKIDGRDSYKLKLAFKSGETKNIWIDAQTFLETKIQGSPRRLDSHIHPVEVAFKDFRSENGLMIPHLLETRVLPTQGGPTASGMQSSVERILIEKVKVNPALDEALFSKPEMPGSVHAKQTIKNTSGRSLP
jgi:hypothetical protein